MRCRRLYPPGRSTANPAQPATHDSARFGIVHSYFLSILDRMRLPKGLPLLMLGGALAGCIAASAQEGVRATLPNGREIHPAGNWIPLAPYPFAVAVRPDAAQAAIPSIG